MSWRVLLVDDEELVIKGIQRNLQSIELDVDVALSGKEGLRLFKEKPYDVVISDLRMPEMDGNQFLNEICIHYPQSIRMVLSGYAEKKMLLDSIGVTHQLLAKPCDPQLLELSIRKALELKLFLKNDDLCRLISKIDRLPSLPKLFLDLQFATQNPESTIDEIAEIIEKDPPMMARIFQLANSPCFGVGGVHRLADAIKTLGITTIKSLVLMGSVFDCWSQENSKTLQLDALWSHSLLTSWYSKQLASSHKHDPTFCELCSTAGLLHDIGKVIFLVLFAEEYSQIVQESRRSKRPLIDCEKEAFGVAHPEVGAYLLGLWGLPTPIVEAVLYHHQPNLSTIQEISPLSFVHIAESLSHFETSHSSNQGGVDEVYLKQIGLSSDPLTWKIQRPIL